MTELKPSNHALCVCVKGRADSAAVTVAAGTLSRGDSQLSGVGTLNSSYSENFR